MERLMLTIAWEKNLMNILCFEIRRLGMLLLESNLTIINPSQIGKIEFDLSHIPSIMKSFPFSSYFNTH